MFAVRQFRVAVDGHGERVRAVVPHVLPAVPRIRSRQRAEGEQPRHEAEIGVGLARLDELIDLVQRGEVVPDLGRGGRQAATTRQVATGHGKSLEVAYLSGRRVETVMSVVTSGAILWSVFRGRTAADLIFPDAGVNEPQLGPFVMFTMFVSWFLAYRVTEDRVRRNERLGLDAPRCFRDSHIGVHV